MQGKYVAEIFCQDLAAVKKFSDCVNDIKSHLKQGETKENGMSFISKLKKKIEMHVPRDRWLLLYTFIAIFITNMYTCLFLLNRFNLIEPRMLADGMQLSRALVSIAQKIGTANASGSSMPQCM